MPYVTSVERLGMQKGFEQGLQQGLQQGVQQGLQQGIQQGKLQAAREMLLDAVAMRFGGGARRRPGRRAASGDCRASTYATASGFDLC